MDINISNKKYPIETEAQLEKAASYFNKYLMRFSPEERVKIANAIDVSSRKFGKNIDLDWVTNYSRMEKSAAISPDFEFNMNMRKEASRQNNERDEENFKLIDGIKKMASKEDVSSKDLVKIVSEFDKKAGIEHMYDRVIVDPIMTVHGSLSNPEFDGVKVAGKATQYDLVRASNEQEKVASLEESFGKEFGKSFKTNPISSLKKLGGLERERLAEIILG